MIKQSIRDAMNEQINAEMYSAYLYFAMAAHFEDQNLDGFAQWMKVQAQEEMAHALKFYSEIFERGGRVVLEAIEKPPAEWESPLAAFEAAYAHEQKVTGLINDIVGLARTEKDYAAEAFLQWFVTEQVEEEATAKGIVDKLAMIGDHPQGLFMMDRELGQRTVGAGAEDGEE